MDLRFYDELASSYHLLFEDWDRTITRQAKVLAPLLGERGPETRLKILDCACGIGTQALGFAALGHQVVASDISPGAVDRARREAQARSLAITFHISDMTSLGEITEGPFDVIAALDNALPHLTRQELGKASHAIAARLKPGGRLLASIRDYDALLVTRPAIQEPAMFGDGGSRRIVHQVWDWIDGESYTVHLYLTVAMKDGWKVQHFVSRYRCLLREELTDHLVANGFVEVRWMMPEQTGFYQPIVLATLAR